jgi:cyclopropane-fatty-acyl-phospholipid synthase
MSMITSLAGSLIKRGQVTVLLPGGGRETLGPGDGPDVTIRITDGAALRQLIRRPRVAIGELYMDGRLLIEQGSMIELLEIVVNSNPFEEGGTRGKSAMSKGRVSAVRALFRRNPSARSRRNVAHHYDLDDRLYDLFLDPWRQYSCAYFTDPSQQPRAGATGQARPYRGQALLAARQQGA